MLSPPQLTNQTMGFSFAVEQDIPVKNLKPAPVKVYDYYETGEWNPDTGALIGDSA